MTSLLWILFSSGCEEPPPFEGEGGIIDSPISTVVFGDYAYVSNGNFDLSGNKKGWVAVIDIPASIRNRKQAVVNRVFTEPYLGQMVINKAGTLIYIANRSSNNILLMDMTDPFSPELIDLNPDKGGIQGIRVGIAPIGLALSPDESLLFVANVGSGDLSIIDTVNRRLIKNERLGSGINSVSVDPQGEYVYVSNKGINSISMLDIETGKFVTSFAVGNPNSGIGQDTRGIAFSKDGAYAYIAAREPPSLMIVDTSKLPHYPERAVLNYIPMDSKPTAVKLSPDGSEIWVANYNSSNIYVVDAKYHNIIDVINVGIGPYDIAFSGEIPEGSGHRFVYICNFFSHNITLVDGKTKEVIWAIP